MGIAPRAVVVSRPTEYEALLARHGTRAQVAFFLERRGGSLAELDERHHHQEEALRTVAAAIPFDWRRAGVSRPDLDRWLFAPEDIIIAVGQDGLVANVAKYLDGQPVIGVDPDPGVNAGVLVRHRPGDVAAKLSGLVETSHDRGHAHAAIERRTMVRAITDDGQELRALNEVFVGHRTHQSARYRLTLPDGRHERHSSSGILVGTGTGSTGWCRSVWLERQSGLSLPEPTSTDLVWFAREAWPSPATGTELVEGLLAAGAGGLTLTCEREGLVAFGDGIERDRIELAWGQRIELSTDPQHLQLVA